MRRLSKVVLCLACLWGAACAGPAPGPGPVEDPSESLALATDPCAMRLHDISAAMLMYINLHKRMPESLEQLRPLADAGEDFHLVCPVSGKPYVYVPAGLGVVDQDRVLVIFDSEPAHNGWTWDIVLDPAVGNQPLTLTVVRHSQPVLKAYLEGGQ